MSENHQQEGDGQRSAYRGAHFRPTDADLPSLDEQAAAEPAVPEPAVAAGQAAGRAATESEPAAAAGQAAAPGFDPFVSSEDPYPYASITPASDGASGAAGEPYIPSVATEGVDNTDDYLAAAQEGARGSGFVGVGGQGGSGGTAPGAGAGDADLREYYDIARYHSNDQHKRRVSIARVVILVVVVVLLSVAAAAAIYVANINARLTENVTTELREELTHSEPGDPFYLLLLGIDKDQSRWEGDDSADYGADDHAYRSDSIMLCRIDPKNVKVTMVSIHRDTLIDMDEYGEQKINAAYAFGGSAYATKVVSEFAGVPISHYAEIDLDRFITIVDQIGGVTVTLPVPVYDPDYTGLDLPAGEQTLNGTEAALLCRCRHGYDEYGDGDKFRAANQRMVFSEVIKKVLNSDPATIAATITTMADSVTTDMTVASILDLAGQMQHLNVDTDIMTGMEPTDGVYVNEGWYEICLVDQWQKMMTRVDQGLPPYDESEGERDSTAGIAGGVGEEGERMAEAAVAADNAEAIAEGL